MVQRNAMRAWQEGVPLKSLLTADAEVMRHLTADDIETLFDLKQHFRQVDQLFKRVGL
jgi:adenylosuccinate lyase